jgi:hypothetical protein
VGQTVASDKLVKWHRLVPGPGRRKTARQVLMTISSKYLFVVRMDIDADKETLFNEIYDTEHIPNLLKVSGVRGVTRMA